MFDRPISMFDNSKVKKEISQKNYNFYKRSLVDKEAHITNKVFSEERFKFSYLLDDMAGLIDNAVIASFLRYHAALFRDNLHGIITKDEIETLKMFLKDAYPMYKNIEYIIIDNPEERIRQDKKKCLT